MYRLGLFIARFIFALLIGGIVSMITKVEPLGIIVALFIIFRK